MKSLFYPHRLSLLFCSLFLIISISSPAQVGINTTNPDNDAILDVVSTAANPGGLLLPRVALTGTANAAPLSAHVQGMTVYNTATAADVTPGYYYNDGNQWVRIAADAPSDDWSRTGNAGTVAGTNFLGTTDNVALRFRTNNTERFEISSGNAANRGRLRAFEDGSATRPVYSWDSDTDLGMYRIGTNTLGFSALQTAINGNPQYIGDRFTVNGSANEYAINGYVSGTTGVALYGENSSNGGTGVLGTVSAGDGVYGENRSGVGNGVFGYSTNVGVRGYGAHGAIMESGLNAGYGLIAWNTTSSGSNRTGLIATGQNLGLISFPTTGAILYGSGSGAVGFAENGSGTGLYGVGNGGLAAISLTTGAGIAGTGDVTGVYGISTAVSGSRQGAYFTMNKNGAAIPSASDDPVAILAGYNGTDYFGGYFDGNQDNVDGGDGYDYAYVGIRSGGTTYKVVGTGSNSTMVDDASGNKRVLFSPEAPEILFEDYGTAKLINGIAMVKLDPLLSSIIHVSDKHPLKVFIQLEGECNGVFVTDKSKNGFMVKELANGKSNVSFSWHIVANRADTKLPDGTVFSKHVDVRFPLGPNKIKHSQITERSATSNSHYSDSIVKIKEFSKHAQKYKSEEKQNQDTGEKSSLKL